MVREATQWEREEMEKVVRDFSHSRICSDSGSAKPVSPKENATDYLYPIVNAMGGFGPSLFIVHRSVILAAFWLCHIFQCTSLVVLFCYLQSSSLLIAGTFWPSCNFEKNGILAWKSHSSLGTALHALTELL